MVLIEARCATFPFFFFSSRRRHTRYIGDWSSDVCSSDLCRLATASARVTQYSGLITHHPSLITHHHHSSLITHHFCETEYRSEERRVGKECRYRWWS